ncbi:MAG: hypothetical protein IJ735_06015 [Clostridia bacterium]|nr:hypothetical protein [Clostridia bacterium]
MQKKRLFNALSLVGNLTILFVTATIITENFRSDIAILTTLLITDGWGLFRYFTVLSNVLMALVSAATLYYNVRNIVRDEYVFPAVLMKIKFAATTAVSVTFLTVVFFLSPMFSIGGSGYFTLFAGNNFFMHFSTPVIAILTFILFERTELKFVESLYGVIPTFLYSILYVLTVAVFKVWEDFYGFTFGGQVFIIPISLVVMYAATFGIAVGLRALQKLCMKKVSLE